MILLVYILFINAPVLEMADIIPYLELNDFIHHRI